MAQHGEQFAPNINRVYWLRGALFLACWGFRRDGWKVPNVFRLWVSHGDWCDVVFCRSLSIVELNFCRVSGFSFKRL